MMKSSEASARPDVIVVDAERGPIVPERYLLQTLIVLMLLHLSIPLIVALIWLVLALPRQYHSGVFTETGFTETGFTEAGADTFWLFAPFVLAFPVSYVLTWIRRRPAARAWLEPYGLSVLDAYLRQRRFLRRSRWHRRIGLIWAWLNLLLAGILIWGAFAPYFALSKTQQGTWLAATCLAVPLLVTNAFRLFMNKAGVIRYLASLVRHAQAPRGIRVCVAPCFVCEFEFRQWCEHAGRRGSHLDVRSIARPPRRTVVMLHVPPPLDPALLTEV